MSTELLTIPPIFGAAMRFTTLAPVPGLQRSGDAGEGDDRRDRPVVVQCPPAPVAADQRERDAVEMLMEGISE